MEKIKVLEVNNIDLPGRRFNGYDMIENLSGDFLEIKQMVGKNSLSKSAMPPLRRLKIRFQNQLIILIMK